MLQINKIESNKCSRIILAGDLSGFSKAYDQGNTLLVSEFIRRFYLLVSGITTISKGNLIKFTGDGFLSVWNIDSDFKKNSKHAHLALMAANELARIVRISKLNVNIRDHIFLRQALTLEPNAIKLTMKTSSTSIEDYLGNMINFAFRIESLATSYPYISLHSDFYDLIPEQYQSELYPLEVSDDELMRVFKGLKVDRDKIYFIQSYPEPFVQKFVENAETLIKENKWNKGLEEKSRKVKDEFLKEHPEKPERYVIKFSRDLNEFYKSGPDWLNESYYKYWAFIKSMEFSLYDGMNPLENMKKIIEGLK